MPRVLPYVPPSLPSGEQRANGDRPGIAAANKQTTLSGGRSSARRPLDRCGSVGARTRVRVCPACAHLRVCGHARVRARDTPRQLLDHRQPPQPRTQLSRVRPRRRAPAARAASGDRRRRPPALLLRVVPEGSGCVREERRQVLRPRDRGPGVHRGVPHAHLDASARACARACVRLRVRVCARMCVCVFVRMQARGERTTLGNIVIAGPAGRARADGRARRFRPCTAHAERNGAFWRGRHVQ